MKIVGIAVLVLLVALVTFKVVSGHVDRSKPEAVATAFTAALKAEDFDTAATYYVPADAQAWKDQAAATDKKMGSNMHASTFDDIPAKPVFVSSHAPKSAANELNMKAEGVSVDVRQIDGKWFVFRAPL